MSYASYTSLSIHAPSCRTTPSPTSFNPRAMSVGFAGTSEFQSTRPARGATLFSSPYGRSRCVSIHAPRAGRDLKLPKGCQSIVGFNPRAPQLHWPRRYLVSIHAPRAGRDRCLREHRRCRCQFQSTRPARGATIVTLDLIRRSGVSIHAPRAGRDAPLCGISYSYLCVSIHAPRAGRDLRHVNRPDPYRSFNPRAPRGARLAFQLLGAPRTLFQSTRPARGAT